MRPALLLNRAPEVLVCRYRPATRLCSFAPQTQATFFPSRRHPHQPAIIVPLPRRFERVALCSSAVAREERMWSDVRRKGLWPGSKNEARPALEYAPPLRGMTGAGARSRRLSAGLRGPPPGAENFQGNAGTRGPATAVIKLRLGAPENAHL